jgi:hypothetical protein
MDKNDTISLIKGPPSVIDCLVDDKEVVCALPPV